MDSETAFLLAHASARGKDETQLSTIVDSYAAHQKSCKDYDKLVSKKGNTDRTFCEVAIGRYLELENKLRSVLEDDFTKAIRAFKRREESRIDLKRTISDSGMSNGEIVEIFPMLKEFK